MIKFGNHYLARAEQKDREVIRCFYTGAFECELQSSDGLTADIPENIDLFFFAGNHCFGVEYQSAGQPTLSQEQHYLASWMEIRSDDVSALKDKCLALGAVEITDFWDKAHFYFHAPGGQVYRLVGMDEGQTEL